MALNKNLAVIPFWEDDGASSFEEVKQKPTQRIVYIEQTTETIRYTDDTSFFSIPNIAPFCKV